MESNSETTEGNRDTHLVQASNASDSPPMPLQYLFDKDANDTDTIIHNMERQSSFDEKLKEKMKTFEAHERSNHIPNEVADLSDKSDSAPLPLQFLFDNKEIEKQWINSVPNRPELSRASEGPAVPVCMQEFDEEICKEKISRHSSPIKMSRRTRDSLPSQGPMTVMREDHAAPTPAIPSTDRMADSTEPNFYPVEATLVSDAPDAVIIPVPTSTSSPNPVYDAVLVPEQQPWWKKHQRLIFSGIGMFVSVLIIIVFVVVSVVPFSSKRIARNHMTSEQISSDNQTAADTEVEANAKNEKGDLTFSTNLNPSDGKPSLNDPNSQKSKTCISSIKSEGYLFESHCGVCDPIVKANGATVVAAKRRESLEFFDFVGNNFELVSSIEINYIVSDVSIMGSTAAIGAAHVDSSGSVFVFERDVEGSWAKKNKIEVPSDTSYNAMFGTSLDIGKNDDYFISDPNKVGKKEQRRMQQDWGIDEGNISRETMQNDFTKVSGETYIIVGAPNDRPTPIGIGSASIFRRNKNMSTWTLETKIRTAYEYSGQFGSSVSAKGDIIAVSDPSHGWGRYSGAVFTYLYNSSSISWEKHQVITNDDCITEFGSTVLLTDSGGMIIGCPQDANPTSLFYYTQSDPLSEYTFTQKITLSGKGGFQAGNRVVVDGKVMAIGSTNVIIYTQVENKWRSVARIDPPPLSQNFGKKPALLQNMVLVPSSSNVHRYSFSTGQCLGLEGRLEVEVLQQGATFSDMDANDPRKLALHWISNEDGLNLSADSESLKQRYVMTLLAFSLDSEAWPHYSIDNETGAEYVNIEWLSDTDECTWYGVTCSEGVVVAIELEDSSLIGTLPPEICILENLEILDLSSNCLYGTIPSEFGQLSNLMRLDFKDNHLSGFIPDSFFDLKSLVQLDLSHNTNYGSNCTGSNGEIIEIQSDGLEGKILEDKIENLHYLMDIDLTNNYFSGTISPKISALKNLERLVVDYNVFQSSIPNEITTLENIRELWLSINYFTGVIPRNIGNLKKLESFSLWGNEDLKGSLPESLYDLANLEDLHLYRNTFTGSINSKIGQLTKLKQLTLAENKFNGTLPSELGLCENLEFLRIEMTDISGAVPSEVCSLTSKHLFSDDRYEEYFKADCLPENLKNVAYIVCDCCSSCCDHTTQQCNILDK